VSKKPAIKHGYDRKKDRFEITRKRFSLKKKWLRTELVDALLGVLDKKSVRHKRPAWRTRQYCAAICLTTDREDTSSRDHKRARH